MKQTAPDVTDPEAVEVFRVWRMMGRRIDWQGLPVVAELVGVEDLEGLVAGLLLVADRVEAGNA
jgi:UDP-N-acetylglucosamine enolpyruvyl transferase